MVHHRLLLGMTSQTLGSQVSTVDFHFFFPPILFSCCSHVRNSVFIKTIKLTCMHDSFLHVLDTMSLGFTVSSHQSQIIGKVHQSPLFQVRQVCSHDSLRKLVITMTLKILEPATPNSGVFFLFVSFTGIRSNDQCHFSQIHWLVLCLFEIY